jgi:hypothetical protein
MSLLWIFEAVWFRDLTLKVYHADLVYAFTFCELLSLQYDYLMSVIHSKVMHF